MNLDLYLQQWSAQYGAWLYLIIFLIIFCETGLIVMPLLPGDSLLFAVGALCATAESSLNVYLMAVLLIAAAITGDSVNYSVGRMFRHRMEKWNRFINKSHFEKAENFYKRYGAKTIVLARFAPIVRTYAPFVAGVSVMDRKVFLLYNVVGAVAWVLIFLMSGYYFAGLEIVKERFHLVIFGIVLVSLLPIAIEFIKHKRSGSVKA